MEVLLMMAVSFGGYILMYKFYGNFIAKTIFKLSVKNIVPSVKYEDGVDYVPTKKEIIFGHHFTSIAGTGPIVGPAIAIIWGWLPALLWVFLGSVFMGAVHDFGSLVISMRNEGKSISDITEKYINRRAKILFYIVVFLTLWIVIAVFGLVIAIIFSMYPASVLAVWLQIPISIFLGYMIYKKNANAVKWSIISLLLLYLTMYLGQLYSLDMPSFFGIPATGVWTVILLVYAYIASVLPVTTLLQPRDFINAYQLLIAMALLALGAVFSIFDHNFIITAPAVQLHPQDAPPMWPFLFITVACGAISGFHSLVASGTSAKQVISEKDTLFVGYGSMLVESALAVLVIIAVTAGISMGYTTVSGLTLFGTEAWHAHYASWGAAAGLGSKVGAFVEGSANMIASTGLSREMALVIMGVFIASFAGTTLDSATRIQRYVVSELAADFKVKALKNRYIATFLVVLSAAFLAFASGADGKGALSLWPMFGAVNQTLAALALMVLTLYLRRQGGWKWLISGFPALFMSVMTLWASLLNELDFIEKGKTLLIIINGVILLIVLLVISEGFIQFLKTEEPEDESIHL